VSGHFLREYLHQPKRVVWGAKASGAAALGVSLGAATPGSLNPYILYHPWLNTMNVFRRNPSLLTWYKSMIFFLFSLSLILVVALFINHSRFSAPCGRHAGRHWVCCPSCSTRGHHQCDSTTSEMRVLSPKIISGDSQRSENAQTHIYKHTIPYMKFKLKILHIKWHVLEFTQDKA
jgi:hypothetical protein